MRSTCTRPLLLISSLIPGLRGYPTIAGSRYTLNTQWVHYRRFCMGSMFSTQKSQTTERSTSHVPLIESTTLKSPPSGKLFDAMHIQIALNPAAYQGLLHKGGIDTVANYHWHVDLELDVAHAKHIRTLCKLPTTLDSPRQQIHIPGHAFAAATVNTAIETLSNVGTIQLSLRDGEGHRVSSDKAVSIIMHVTQGSFGNAATSKEELLRSFYGIVADNDVEGRDKHYGEIRVDCSS